MGASDVISNALLGALLACMECLIACLVPTWSRENKEAEERRKKKRAKSNPTEDTKFEMVIDG